MNIFYSPDAQLNEYCELDETESRHVGTVLRKREGEELYVFDGKGNLYEARVEAIGKKSVTVKPVKLTQKDSADRPRLHIAIAPPKNIVRFEWFVEKATEIGVGTITPIICTHSERKDLRIDRLTRVLLSACKQSLKLTMPVLNEAISFNNFTDVQNNDTRKYIAYCDEKPVHLKDAYKGGFDATVMIGPEGDFTKEEVLLADKFGFETVGLGSSRLRLETAGIFAATVFNLANEQ